MNGCQFLYQGYLQEVFDIFFQQYWVGMGDAELVIQFVHRKFKEGPVHPDDPAKEAIIKFKEVGNAEPYFVGEEWQWCHG